MSLAQLFLNIATHYELPINFDEDLEVLSGLDFQDSGLDLKNILETVYTDGITGFENVVNDGAKITGVFLDQITPKITKRFQFTVTTAEIRYEMLNPGDLDNLDFSELDFATTAKVTKEKKCVKGQSCRNSCISRLKTCSYKNTPAEAKNVQKLLDKSSIGKSIQKPLGQKNKTKDTGKNKAGRKQKERREGIEVMAEDLNAATNTIMQSIISQGNYANLADLRSSVDLPKEDFDNLLMDLQSRRLVYLMGGSKREGDLTDDDKANAIKSEIRGYLSSIELTDEGLDYAKKLQSNETKPSDIKDYSKFKQKLETEFSKLEKENRGLVPIYKLRESLGLEDKDFDKWLMKAQADGDFYLQSGEARGATQEQKDKSIMSDVRGLLFFVSRP